jgi:F-type H+-transporting ATPase subunit b
MVVWLLNRFLFKPVLRNMKLREDAIQAKLAKAASELKEAEKKSALAEKQINDFENARVDMMDKAIAGVKEEEASELQRFKSEMVVKRETFRRELESERAKMSDDVKLAVGRAFLATFRKAFFMFGGGKLEISLLDNFIAIAKSGKMSGAKELARLAGSNTIYIESSFVIPPAKRAALKKALRAKRIEFKTSREILCGLRVACSDLELSFSLDDYMDDLALKITGGENV